LRKNNKPLIAGVADYFVHEEIITDYVRSNTSLSNNGVSCQISQIEVLRDEIYIVLSDGLGVSYRFDCEQDIKDIQLELAYFIEFPLQTNRITLYNLTGGIK
jgi:accessory colonization factor AcfC